MCILIERIKKDFNPFSLQHKYPGKNYPDCNCWLVKYTGFDSDQIEFAHQNFNDCSMLIIDEYVMSVCECDNNVFVIAVLRTDLLIVRDWQVTHTVEDPSVGNDQKDWLCPLPNFNL